MRLFGFFYYSKKQKWMRDGLGWQSVYMKPLFGGEVREHTEWVSRFPFLPSGKWSDFKLVGVGYLVEDK